MVRFAESGSDGHRKDEREIHDMVRIDRTQGQGTLVLTGFRHLNEEIANMTLLDFELPRSEI